MQTIDILYNNIPFKVRKHFEREDMNVLGEVFMKQITRLNSSFGTQPKVVVDVGGHVGSFKAMPAPILADVYSRTRHRKL